jgi:Na+-driven multidrug efflux pump
VSHPQKERMDGNAVNDDNYQLLRETSGASSIEEKEEVPPYSFKYETYYFFSKGIPLMLSATLEWGVPPWAALAFAGHTHNSSQLQSALGYSRVFYNITTLMTLFSAITYFSTVIPGAIGAGRKDRVRKYFQTSVVLVTLFWIPIAILQLFAGNIMFAVGVPKDISNLVGIYTKFMIPVGWMLMMECHLEITFINLGYEKCAAFNSVLTGLGVDVACTYFFVYKWEWGIEGVALAQMVVKGSRILVWIVLMYYFNLNKYFYGSKEKRNRMKKRKNLHIGSSPLQSLITENHHHHDGGDKKSGGVERGNEEEEEEEEEEDEAFFTLKEFRIFVKTAIPTLGTYFTGWLIFELQIICLGHIAEIPTAAVAAGAIWVQTESTLAAVQRGWILVTSMRTIKLMGTNDPVSAKKAYAVMCILSFVLVSLTNVPLLFFKNDVSILISNDRDVQKWLNQILWVLAVHQSTRICSINSGALYIAIERGGTQVLQNIVSFYIIASPIAGIAALTNLITKDIAIKMMFCVATTSVAQFIIGCWAFLDMGCRQDWIQGCQLITDRANNDRLKKEMLSRQNSRVDEEEGEGQKEDHTDIFVLHSPLSSPMLRSRS